MAPAFEGAPTRFYTLVEVVAADAGFAVRLDGRSPRSPGGRPLVFPARALAELIAVEWRSQGRSVDLATMPATRLAHTALDGIPVARAATIAGVVAYASADTICYFADHPRSLTARQDAAWSPWLDWARDELRLEFHRASGIVHREQPPATLAAVGALVTDLDDFALAGVAFGAALFASAVIALALARGRLTGEAALAASRVEAAFQAEQWGIDAEAARHTAALLADAAMLEAWFAALNEG